MDKQKDIMIPEPLLMPVIEVEHSFFWESLSKNELRIQKCSKCAILRYPPNPMCSQCQFFEHSWELMSGNGEIFSYVVTHQPTHSAFRDRTPLATVIVELDEGPRLVSNILNISPSEIKIGMKVRVVFQKMDDEITLPFFELID